MVQKKKAPAKSQKKEKESVRKSSPTGGQTAKPKKKEVSSSSDPQNALGKKYTCHSCSTKFYDLNKPEKICPKCRADQTQKPTGKQKGRASKVSEYDITEDEIAEVPDELIDETEEIEIDEETVIDEEEV